MKTMIFKEFRFQVGCLSLLIFSACGKQENVVTAESKNNSAQQTPRVTSVDPNVTNRLRPPASVSASYASVPNSAISDDFNGTGIDFNIWQYRTDGGSPNFDVSGANAYLATVNGERFLTLKGNAVGKKSVGISTKVTAKYGFYIVKWAALGMSNSSYSGWHPAVWGAARDFSTANNSIPAIATNSPRLEADFMEATDGSNPTWDQHLILWPQRDIIPGTYKQTVWPNTSGSWSTLGMEYTPTMIRFWWYVAGTWSIKKTINIKTSGPYNDNNIPSSHATDMYWILSNKVEATINSTSYFRIDYFYHYPRLDI
jgi:hypothetical protein